MECEEVHMKPVRLQQEEVQSIGVVNLQPAEGGGGKDGVGIASIEQIETSVESGGVNIIKVTLTNGSSAVFEVRNGKDGINGTDGHTPVITSQTVSGGVHILSDGVVIGTIPVGGNGVATPIEDNLTSDRTDAALSAKQGKNLKTELDTLGSKVDEINGGESKSAIVLKDEWLKDVRLTSDGTWNANGTSYFIPRSEIGDIIEVKGNSSSVTRLSMLKDESISSVNFCTGFKVSDSAIGVNEEKSYIVLSDCAYIAISATYTGNNILPQKIVSINKHNGIIPALEKRVTDLERSCEVLPELIIDNEENKKRLNDIFGDTLVCYTIKGAFVRIPNNTIDRSKTNRDIDVYDVEIGDYVKIEVKQNSDYMGSAGSIISLWNDDTFVKNLLTGDASKPSYSIEIKVEEGNKLYISRSSNGNSSATKVGENTLDVIAKSAYSLALKTSKELEYFGQIIQGELPKYNKENKVFRILCFGSSWFQNTWWYLNKMLYSLGINAEITAFYVGGSTFDQWINRYNSNENIACWTSTNGSDWAKTNKQFRTTLELDNYDMVAFQQGARQAIDESEWSNWSDLVSIIRRSVGSNVYIAYNATWTPPYNSEDRCFVGYEKSREGQQKWQNLNNQNTLKFMRRSGIANVSPNGQMMWIMRNSDSTKNETTDLATDGLHPDNGLPCYGLALCFIDTFVSKIFDVKIEDCNWLPSTSTQKNVVSSSTSFVEITDEQRKILCKMVRLSQSQRFGFRTL